MTKKIVVFGGDGFCGWPTALHLSNNGYQVIIVDNFSRRAIDHEISAGSLTPITSMETRLNAWQEVSGKKIGFVHLDIAADYQRLLDLLLEEKPDSVVHFAEQRAAPYSMKSSKHKAYTVNNNINATNNILAAIVESGLDIHLVHLGTMGVYGYTTPGLTIPEGYLTVTVETDSGPQEQKIIFPPNPGSIYHMTKVMDAQMFAFYAKNDELRITDLHQGIVWGTNTPETASDPRLINRFDYDGDYGTVLNRFLMQAAVGVPLTVHGTGGQTRAFIHVRDTVKCIHIALENPPAKGDRVKIFNQVTETHTLKDLAEQVNHLTGCEVAYLPNPRKEAEANDLIVDNNSFLSLGLDPITLERGLMDEVVDIARKFIDRHDPSKIRARTKWVDSIQLEDDTSGETA